MVSKRKYVSGTRWCVWRWTTVDPDNSGFPYLERLHLVQTPWFSVMLHWIHRGDPHKDLHDHPVSFLSLVLRGGYIEVTDSGYEAVRYFNFKRATDKHRIALVYGNLLTLVLAGPVTHNWGFHTSTGRVPWREYK